MLGRKVIYVSCINCSYNDVARGIRPGGGGGGGGTLIFSYVRRLSPFFGVQNFEFRYFLGFSKK